VLAVSLKDEPIMPSRSLILILVPLLLAGSACERRHGNSGPLRASTIYAGDPNVAAHFTQGFYGVEEKAWRWTAKDFAVTLSPPLHADQKGAQLMLNLDVPDSVIQKLGSVQLRASVNGYKLDPEVYSKSGNHTYTRDIPADHLKDDIARVDFSLDHAMPGGDTDRRELGIIVSEVGLVAK
jgi:hypothetical protein